MKYIYDKIILVTKYEKLHTYFKTKVVGGFFWWFFFCGHYYWYISNESRAIWKFKNFGWKFIKNMCFFIFPAIKAKYFMYLTKKINTKWKRKRIYSWALHYFFRFLLFSNVLWTTNIRPYGWQKTTHYICCVH